MTGQDKTCGTEGVAENREVAARGGDAVTETARWSRAQFYLAARLQGQQASARKDARLLQAAQDLANYIKRDRKGWVSRIMDEPL